MAGLKTVFIIPFLIFVFSSYANLANGKRTLVTLDEDNWNSLLSGQWMVEFYAPWCPACKALQPVWESFASWSDDLGINVAKIDVTSAPGLSGRFMVTALPTIFHVLDGNFRQYRGGRDKDSLISFVEEKKWQSIEPIAWWKSPDSIQMSIVAYFFKLSTVLRHVHNSMVDDYGLPVWGSYLVFAVATILVGAMLGLLLVCVIDNIYQPKTVRHSPLSSIDNDEGDEGDDLIDEGAESGAESPAERNTDDENESQGEAESQEDEVEAENDVVEGESSPNVRKRRARKAD